MDIKTILIDERSFTGTAEENSSGLHALLSGELGFPAYYGGNLAALSDCLGDVCEPVRFVVDFESAEHYRDCIAMLEGEADGSPTWLERFVRVIARTVLENGCLELVLAC